jgi:hypothetical protein
MDVSEAQEAKQLRDENTRLKKLVVDLSLDKEMLPWTSGRTRTGCGASTQRASTGFAG